MVMPDSIGRFNASIDNPAVRRAMPRSVRLWLLGIALGALFGVVDSWQSYYLGYAVGIRLPFLRVLVSNTI